MLAGILAAEEPWTRAVFLGDFFDDFGDGPAEARATARWLGDRMQDPRLVFLWGNHDLSYAFPQNAALWCPGFTPRKQAAIAEVLSPAHWNRLKLCHFEGPWLLSHAGFHPAACPGLGPGGRAAVERTCAQALSTLTASPAWPIRGRPLPTLMAWGRDRGGDAPAGGCTWLDWSRLLPIAGLHQIVGHTPGARGMLRHGHHPDGSSLNFCLDDNSTRLCAVLAADGSATFKEVLADGRNVLLDQVARARSPSTLPRPRPSVLARRWIDRLRQAATTGRSETSG